MEMDWMPTVFVIIQLVFLEGILSLDNAAVLGAMVSVLPEDEPIPWPAWARPLHFLDKFLGPQREAALKVGLLGAYAGRAIMLLVASFIVQNLWLRLLGAGYLVYLALKHFAEMSESAHQTDENADGVIGRPRQGFWMVVLGVELADLAFSLDNVIAAVALSKLFWVVMLGVAIGILTMRFAAQLFSRLIRWESALEHAAYLLVFSIGLQLVLQDLFSIELGELHLGFITINHEIVKFLISLLILLVTVLCARIAPLRALTRALSAPFFMLCRALMLPFKIITWPLGKLAGALRG